MYALYMRSEKGEKQAGDLPAETRDRPSPDIRVLSKWHVYFMH